jgi:hypothetical protein
MVAVKMSCHKEHTYEIPITYHSKDMANVKVFACRQTNRQNNRQTNRRTDHIRYVPDLSIRGHKKLHRVINLRGHFSTT